MNFQRYRKDRFRAESLKDNPLGSPQERDIRIYLPPGYRDGPHYPAVYLLHGYGADNNTPVVDSRRGLRSNYPLWLRLLFRRIFAGLLTFELLDRLIVSGELPPFVLVQPDASLHLPNIFAVKGLDRRVGTKGSLYTDSRSSGNYATYIFQEVPAFVEAHYRVIGEKRGRCLVGGSMGGYGALLGGILYPERFRAVAALSPSISCLDLLDVKLVVPLNRILFGRAKAERLGRAQLGDILDTCDLVFSDDRRLLPTLKRDEGGRTVAMDDSARRNWARSDLGGLLESNPQAFRDIRLALNCAEHDEFAFAEPCRRFHGQLGKREIEHAFEIYPERKAERLSPHVLGIARHILPALRFCLDAVRP